LLSFFQSTSLKNVYEQFNIEVVSSKVFMTLNMISHSYFLLFVFENKHFINNIINQVIDQFCFKSRLNNAHMNPSFESGEFGDINLTLNVHINTF